MLVVAAFIVEAEAALDLGVRLVQLARHAHGLVELFAVVGVEVFAVDDELRDLPAAARVFEHEGVVEAELGGRFERGLLGVAVDKQLGANAGVAVDPLAVVSGEVTAQVRDALLQRVHVVDFRFLAAKHGYDVVENLAVEVFQEQRIEFLQFIERVELVDDGILVAADGHVELVEVLDVEVLPELVARLRQVVFGFQNFAEVLRERTVEVGVADHVPGVAAADGHLRDAVMRLGLHAPFFRGAFGVFGGVVRFPHVALEGVFLEVVVGRANIGVAQNLAHEHERAVVVALGVGAVDDDFHAIFVFEVEERFLLVANHDHDVVHAGGLELLDLALDEHVAAYLVRPLGRSYEMGAKRLERPAARITALSTA